MVQLRVHPHVCAEQQLARQEHFTATQPEITINALMLLIAQMLMEQQKIQVVIASVEQPNAQ
jgi:hypothetical protein